MCDVLVEEMLGIFDYFEYGVLFGLDSQVEVLLIGIVGGQIVCGQIDCFFVIDYDVLIIDYKSNWLLLKVVEDVVCVYFGQMVFYCNLFREIYVGKRVCCVLLLIDLVDLMELLDGLLDIVLLGKMV